MQSAPTDIKFKRAEGMLEISWNEKDRRRYPARLLRWECGCAGCVDERTGQRILDPQTIPADVSITSMDLVGNYAIGFTFSDGHDTGIYTWTKLHQLCKEPKEPS